jgi:hypothetical protein
MRNRYLEAFKEGGNLLGLAGFAALSAATLNPLPLAVGVALEMVYLAFVPDTKWYQARLSKVFDADVEQRRQAIKDQVFKRLRPEMKERFARLEEMRREIGTQAADNETWFREVLRKLDFLLEKFLQFAAREAQFRNYLLAVLEEVRADSSRSRVAQDAPVAVIPGNFRGRQLKANRNPNQTSAPQAGEDRWAQAVVAQVQAQYDAELGQIKQLVQAEAEAGTKAVLEKRVEVLSRRREFVGKIGRIMTNLNHQLCLLEETFGLISDEIRARPPEQVLADIEDVVSQTNAMTQTLEEMAPYEQMLERIAA